jgi:hypothetical protein
MSRLLVLVLQASILSVPGCTHARPLVFGKINRIISDNNITINNKNIINTIELYDEMTTSQSKYINKTI